MHSPLKAPTQELVRGRLRELIADLQAGDRLPSERALCAEWAVARMTLRGAIDALVAEGLLVRRHGSGTYVAFRPVMRMLGMTSFTHDMRSRGLVPSSRVLEFREVPADSGMAARLRVPVAAPLFTITRLRLGNGEPMAIETVRIPVAYAPDLAERDLKGSLYEVLAERHNIVANAASMTIEPTLPDEQTRELLRIDATQACLRLQMVDADRTGRAIMLATCVYRGDKYQLRAEVSGASIDLQRAEG